MPVKSLINNFYCYPMMGDITGIILVEMYKLKETYECQYKRRNTIVNEKYCGVKREAL